MTNKNKIQNTLIKLGPMCDDCLSAAAMIKPRQTVNIACRGLEKEKWAIRARDICARCGGAKIVNRVAGHVDTKLIEIEGAQRQAAQKLQSPRGPVPTKNHDVEALSEDEIKEVLVKWLSKQGWDSKVAWGRTQGIDVEATRGKERWVIEVKGPGSRPQMRVNYFIGILGETLQRMDDSRARYSIALPELPQYRGLWDRLPSLAKERTKISILFVSINGNISEA